MAELSEKTKAEMAEGKRLVEVAAKRDATRAAAQSAVVPVEPEADKKGALKRK